MQRIDPKTGKEIEANDPRLIATPADRVAAAKAAQAAFEARFVNRRTLHEIEGRSDEGLCGCGQPAVRDLRCQDCLMES